MILLALACASPIEDTGPTCGPLRVATFNLLHGYLDEDPEAQPYDRVEERMELAGPALAAEGLSVLLLQEVVMGATDYPETAELLRQAQGEHWSLTFGDLFGTEPGPTGNGWGQAVLTCHEVLDSANHVVPGGTPRSVLQTRIAVDGREVDLYDVHISGDAESAQTVLEVVESSAGDHVVVGGDFNLSDSEPGMEIFGDAGFVDAIDTPCVETGAPSCTNSTLPLAEPGNRMDQRIDYLFARGLEPEDAAVLLAEPLPAGDGVLWVSDHLPVVATLR